MIVLHSYLVAAAVAAAMAYHLSAAFVLHSHDVATRLSRRKKNDAWSNQRPASSSMTPSRHVVRLSSSSPTIENDHPKRRRRRTTRPPETTQVALDTVTWELTAAQGEASIALKEAAGALANDKEKLARRLGMNSVEDLECAIDAMEGSDYNDSSFDASDVQKTRSDISSSPLCDTSPPSQRRTRLSPFPVMPSPLFASLAQSQFELLSNSLGAGKIQSMILYLPMENVVTGRLEFVPAVTFPESDQREVFIASSYSSEAMRYRPNGPPIMRLPGFFEAGSLIPGYPFVSGGSTPEEEYDGEVGVDGGRQRWQGRRREIFASASNDSPIGVSSVEEIPSPLSSLRSSAVRPPPSLSVTLFGGLDTLGVLVIWPTLCLDDASRDASNVDVGWMWTSDDKLQVSRAARSLALALSMNNELVSSRLANENFRVTLADGMHQVKSPLQALRTFGKLLQRQLAEGGNVIDRAPAGSVNGSGRGREQQQRAIKLAEDILSQGERVIDLIEPMDALIRSDFSEGSRYLLRGDVKEQAQLLTASSTSKIAPYREFKLPPSMPVLGDFELEMAFPQDVLGSIVYASQAISREAGINLDAVGFDPDNDLPGVTVCTRHLTEAVSNLLDNAIKYAPLRRGFGGGGGGRQGKKLLARPRIPQIRVTLVSNEPPLLPGVTLYVEDNGPGIPTSEREKVFARGYRGKAVQDEVDGSGLGLAIARETIARMGGVLEIVDEGPNRLNGTTVRLGLFRDPEI